MKNDIIYFGFLSITILLYYQFYKLKSLIYNSILNELFAFLIINLLSMKVKFNNHFLKFLNLHSFSIYLLQKLVMIPVYKKKHF